MKNGFIKVAAGSVAVSVADVKHNVQQIKERINKALDLLERTELRRKQEQSR